MSTHKSYFNKNNTILHESMVNTAKNPVTEIFYGGGFYEKDCVFTGLSGDTCNTKAGVTLTGYSRQTVYRNCSRFIFDLDLKDLKTKVLDGRVSLTGTGGTTSHTIKMVNTSFFDDRLLNTKTAKANRRATSFDLILFALSGTSWDEGVGYDYDTNNMTSEIFDDKSYSSRPSNWFKSTTLTSWNTPGIYDYTSQLPQIIATQHFDNGNENIEMTITDQIDSLITGLSSFDGFGLAFVRQLEDLSGLTESYSVGFFTRYTQTFFEPYLETKYDDLITDARANFYEGVNQCLYLYVNEGGQPTNLTTLPTVNIYDNSGALVVGPLTASRVTKGIYYVCFTIPCDTYTTPCMFTDRWSNIEINGVCKNDVTNKFVLKDNVEYFNIGTNAGLPKHYGYSVSGIKMDEKIVSGDIRKIIVSARKEYTTNEPEAIGGLKYRVYVTQGTTQIDTVPWTSINKAYNQNYFIIDTGDMIPNEYHIDIKAESNLEENSYPDLVKFQVVNQANYFGNPPS
tara:strand:+ start:8051 stop:9580 length:1530 start_codon:yes stop_codon:yes gene_type:complete